MRIYAIFGISFIKIYLKKFIYFFSLNENILRGFIKDIIEQVSNDSKYANSMQLYLIILLFNEKKSLDILKNNKNFETIESFSKNYKCEQNLCSKCENEHKNEQKLIYYDNIISYVNESEKDEFEFKINKLNNDINDIIKILNKVMNKIKIYYEIYYNFVYKFDLKNCNYQTINNIKEIFNYQQKIVSVINNIIDDIQINSKNKNIINIFYKTLNYSKNIMKYKIKK